MKIFSMISEQNGIGYYRMTEPMRVLGKKVDWRHNPFSPYGKFKDYWVANDMVSLQKNIKRIEKICGVGITKDTPDAFFMQRYDNPFYFSLVLSLKEVYQRPIIQEADDYVYDVPNTNPGKQSYRERPLESAADINDAMTWQRKSLGHFDAYFVTTPFLKQYYENYGPTYMLPNSIDLRKRQFGPVAKHKEIRIGFSASGGHQEGLWFIEPVIDELMAKYKNIVFYYYGGLFDLFSKKSYKNRVKVMKWAPLEKYPEYLHKMAFDIAIAPLPDRLFNRGKSNLRLLEYWSSGKYPVVASPTGHYKDTIKDGVNGLLALERDEWVQKISLLVERPELRKKYGEAGHDTVKKDFNLEKNANLWYNAFRDIIHNYKSGRRSQARASLDDSAGPSTYQPR